jgi:hypothetical protein
MRGAGVSGVPALVSSAHYKSEFPMTDQPEMDQMEAACELPEPPPEPETGLGMAAEFLLGLFVTGFALFVIIESLRMPHRAQTFVMDPGFVPLITGVVLLGLGLILDVRALKAGGAKEVGNLIRMIKSEEESRRFLWILGFITLYMVGLTGRVHFILATLVFMVSIFTYLKIGPWWKIALFTIICTALVSVILPELFGMPIP